MRPVKLPSFFKIPQPRRFDLKPRYYDERREALERRLAAPSAEQGPSVAVDRIRAAYRARRERSSAKSRQAANSRLVIIIVILLVLSYLIFV